MALRTELKEFPFKSRDKSVWYFIVNWPAKIQKDFNNVQGKQDLVRELKTIIDNREQMNNELLGVWHGQYSTDIFKISIQQGYDELNKYFKS